MRKMTIKPKVKDYCLAVGSLVTIKKSKKPVSKKKKNSGAHYNPGSTTNLAFATIKKIDEPGCNVYGLKWATKLPPFFMRKYL